MKRYRVQALCLLLAAALALTGCAARRGGEDTGRLQVVCTLFPYYDFVRAIGGDRVEPYLLVTAGREAHSFEPTPLDVIRISQADVFICNGGESETWVDDILDAAGESIGSVVHMMDHAHVLGEEFSEGMQGGHDHDEHAHDEHDGHDHDGHEEEIEYDEHIWTSPRIAMDLCRVIADTLAQADPAHAQEYQDRLAAYLRELTDLDRAFRDTVEAGQRHLLVFGDRFPLLYFCREYGLDYRAAFHGCSGDTEPSLSDKKGREIQVLEIGDLTTLADYFVIATGSSNTQINALVDNVEKVLWEEAQEEPLHREGYRAGTWVLLDYGCIAIHVFNAEAREFYGLERLWRDGKPLDLTGVVD